MTVWLITFESDIERQRITNSPTKALDVCVEFLHQNYPFSPPSVDIVRRRFLENPNSFGIKPMCWAERVEID